MTDTIEKFYEISPSELDNAIKLIGEDWMLITAPDRDRVNAMTASWGSLGVLWNKPVLTCFIRPQRHTYSLVENTDRFSVAVMPRTYREALRYCGSHSGRDEDKLAACQLSTALIDGVPVICEADTLLICKKLYVGDLKKNEFLCKELLSNYKAGDFHRFYVCEIEKAYKRR